ncbi:MAG: urocanate hydratase [Thermoanaerobacteraceae bacterium]|nr:urocanate hydratase [Thermoanaerobacteraceae bacterium]
MIKTPNGIKLSCKGWQQEGILRLLLNCIDPDIAKDPKNLIAYGGNGKVARDWDSFMAIMDSLLRLENDETLLIQSGKPVGVFESYEDAPRVIMAGSLIVPYWSDWNNFRKLEDKGLTCYGQSTAGSWAFIGAQGILQGTWETFYQLGKAYFNSDLTGKFVLTSGMGAMGSAQPLAATMNGASVLVVDVDRNAIKRSLIESFCDYMTEDIDEAISLIYDSIRKTEPISVGLLGNAAWVYPEILKRGIIPDVVTDQTPAHDLLSYVPLGADLRELDNMRVKEPERYVELSKESIAIQVQSMLEFQRNGTLVFDYGNNIRKQAYEAGIMDAFDIPSFVPLFIRPLFCEGRGPFRWIALSGDPEDIYRTDEVILKEFSDDEVLMKWIPQVEERIRFQGLPSRCCWMNYEERVRFGLIMNDMVRRGILKSPIAITRDHLDSGSVASPYRETEGMMDGSDAIADWPVLNALLNASSGASLVGLYGGGGVGIGYSIHSGMTIVADGDASTDERLSRVLNNDPGLGIIRHADAGYEKAKDIAVKLLKPVMG